MADNPDLNEDIELEKQQSSRYFIGQATDTDSAKLSNEFKQNYAINPE